MMSNNRVPDLVAVAAGDAARHELLALGGDELAVLLPAGLAEVVRLLERVAGETLGDPHDRLLVEHQPVGVAQDLGHLGVDVLGRLPAVLQLGVVAVHVRRHRPGPVQGHEGGDVVEARRREGAQRRAHRRALELEHPDRVAASQHLVGRLVVEGDGVDVGTGPRGLLDEVEGRLDDREVAQPEEVHLQQPELLDPVHLVLGDDRRVGGIGPRLGLALDRQVLGEGLLRDHDRRGVDAVLAAQALEALGHVDHRLRVGVGLVHLPQARRRDVAVLVPLDLLEAEPQRRVPAHDERRHRLGDLVADHVGVARAPGPRRAPPPGP